MMHERNEKKEKENKNRQPDLINLVWVEAPGYD